MESVGMGSHVKYRMVVKNIYTGWHIAAGVNAAGQLLSRVRRRLHWDRNKRQKYDKQSDGGILDLNP